MIDKKVNYFSQVLLAEMPLAPPFEQGDAGDDETLRNLTF
jgi:hypothetical protein